MQGGVLLRVRPPALAIVVLLSGCTAYEPEEHCRLVPDHVRWMDQDFPDALQDAAPDWTVRVVPPPPGIPNQDPTLADWNATVDRLRLPLDGQVTLTVGKGGQTWIANVVDPEPPTLREDVLRALAQATDGNASERAAWTDRLLDRRDQQGVLVEPDGETPHYTYFATLPPERVHIDGLLAGNATGAPKRVVEAGDWRIFLELPTVEAARGEQTFTAHVAGDNLFQDGTWEGAFPEEEALAEFRAAYLGLGVGEPPDDARVGGGIC